ncbi:MAG TPA: NAD(P)-binding domain-containing protein [Polyangiaceae bacterium]|nr:NAD(P)-binding domain-containing protein [Polyangiaceae bacterium]
MARIAILGAGMMGSALALPLIDRGHEVRLIGTHLDESIITALEAGAQHPTLRFPLPNAILPFHVSELARALDGVDAIALGVSSAGVRWAGRALAPLLRPGIPLLMISKGLSYEGQRFEILPDVLKSELPPELAVDPVAVGGPCIAGELARRVETCIVFTGRNPVSVNAWAELARGPYYHVFTSSDPVGTEVCAALKNAYAMGIGFAAGLHEKNGGTAGSIAMHNCEAALYAQAILEARWLVDLLGGDPESASGLPFAGDLNVTCNGGRTGRFGRFLGQGLGRAGAIAAMNGATLECLEILETLRAGLSDKERLGGFALAELPFLSHMLEVALDDHPVDIPYQRFFRVPRPA